MTNEKLASLKLKIKKPEKTNLFGNQKIPVFFGIFGHIQIQKPISLKDRELVIRDFEAFSITYKFPLYFRNHSRRLF